MIFIHNEKSSKNNFNLIFVHYNEEFLDFVLFFSIVDSMQTLEQLKINFALSLQQLFQLDPRIWNRSILAQ